MVRGDGNVGEEGLGAAAAPLLLVDDRLAQLDALAADIHVAGPLDEGADVAVALPAEGTVGVAVAAGVPGGRACPPSRHPSLSSACGLLYSRPRLVPRLGAMVGGPRFIIGQPIADQSGPWGDEHGVGWGAPGSVEVVASQRFVRSRFGFYGAAERSARTFAASFGPDAVGGRRRRPVGRLGCGRSGRRGLRARDHFAAEDGAEAIEFLLADFSSFIQCPVVCQLVAGRRRLFAFVRPAACQLDDQGGRQQGDGQTGSVEQKLQPRARYTQRAMARPIGIIRASHGRAGAIPGCTESAGSRLPLVPSIIAPPSPEERKSVRPPRPRPAAVAATARTSGRLRSPGPARRRTERQGSPGEVP